MTALVSNLLDMARIESGEVTLNPQWQPIEEVVGSALRASVSLLAARPIEAQIPHDLPLVKFDVVLIERVLVNLLENAAKYTPQGSGICISARVSQRQFQVTVADAGPGIPQGREEAVFQKFMRGERESAMPGVGLGLAICRAIVRAHGGEIAVATADMLGAYRGATITFWLPLGSPPGLSGEGELAHE